MHKSVYILDTNNMYFRQFELLCFFELELFLILSGSLRFKLFLKLDYSIGMFVAATHRCIRRIFMDKNMCNLDMNDMLIIGISSSRVQSLYCWDRSVSMLLPYEPHPCRFFSCLEWIPLFTWCVLLLHVIRVLDGISICTIQILHDVETLRPLVDILQTTIACSTLAHSQSLMQRKFGVTWSHLKKGWYESGVMFGLL